MVLIQEIGPVRSSVVKHRSERSILSFTAPVDSTSLRLESAVAGANAARDAVKFGVRKFTILAGVSRQALLHTDFQLADLFWRGGRGHLLSRFLRCVHGSTSDEIGDNTMLGGASTGSKRVW